MRTGCRVESLSQLGFSELFVFLTMHAVIQYVADGQCEMGYSTVIRRRDTVAMLKNKLQCSALKHF